LSWIFSGLEGPVAREAPGQAPPPALHRRAPRREHHGRAARHDGRRVVPARRAPELGDRQGVRGDGGGSSYQGAGQADGGGDDRGRREGGTRARAVHGARARRRAAEPRADRGGGREEPGGEGDLRRRGGGGAETEENQGRGAADAERAPDGEVRRAQAAPGRVRPRQGARVQREARGDHGEGGDVLTVKRYELYSSRREDDPYDRST